MTDLTPPLVVELRRSLPSPAWFRYSEALRSPRRVRALGAWRRMNEADTFRKFVVPKLLDAGWETEPHSIAKQRTITDGRIVPAGKASVLFDTDQSSPAGWITMPAPG